jgi:hypothetical protein
MKLIAHRALVNGPNPDQENHPDIITKVLAQGFDVEIDVWFQDDRWFLGHDAPVYPIDVSFLYKPGLWVHTKNWKAAERVNVYYNSVNYFWHENDQRVLTSHGYWWTYPNQALGPRSVCVMPEWHTPLESFANLKEQECWGICSDHVGLLV